jgi:hypothetical protein
MELHTAGWNGIWTFLIVFFVVVPSVRWSWGMKGGGRWRRPRGLWASHWGLDDDDRPSRKQIAALREELDSRIADVDSLHTRVAELENRLDFAERLLAESRDRALVSREATSG